MLLPIQIVSSIALRMHGPTVRIKGFLIPPSGTWIPDSNTRQRDSFGFLKLNFGVQDFKAQDSRFHK